MCIKNIYNCRMDEELIRLLRLYNKQTSINVIKNRNCGAPLLGLAKYLLCRRFLSSSVFTFGEASLFHHYIRFLPAWPG